MIPGGAAQARPQERPRLSWPLLPALLLFCCACVAAPAARPTEAPAPAGASADPGGEAAAPSGEAAPVEDLQPHIPPDLLEARDDAERVFACLAWGDAALLEPPASASRQEALDHLITAKAARRLCHPLIHSYFAGFPPLLQAFDAEWGFQLTRLALTAEGYSRHNRETVCANLRQTLRASRQATDTAARFAGWLQEQLAASARQDPLLDSMLQKARAKHQALLHGSTELGHQYRQTCQTPP